jgi:hypothetical protein
MISSSSTTSSRRLSVLAAIGLAAACGTVDADAVPAGDTLIDDLEDGNRSIRALAGREGYWYTLNDGTGGQQTPTPGSGIFVLAEGGAASSAYAVATEGSGFTGWGAKLGVYLHHVGGEFPEIYDASGYDGITFQARGNTNVAVRVLTEAIRGASVGGTCVESEGGCYDYYGMTFGLTAEWRAYEMTFSDMRQAGTGRSIAFDPATVMAIDFTVPANVDFAFAVDDLGFF